MDDLKDLVWQSAGVKWPPNANSQNTPLSQLSSSTSPKNIVKNTSPENVGNFTNQKITNSAASSSAKVSGNTYNSSSGNKYEVRASTPLQPMRPNKSTPTPMGSMTPGASVSSPPSPNKEDPFGGLLSMAMGTRSLQDKSMQALAQQKQQVPPAQDSLGNADLKFLDSLSGSSVSASSLPTSTFHTCNNATDLVQIDDDAFGLAALQKKQNQTAAMPSTSKVSEVGLLDGINMPISAAPAPINRDLSAVVEPSKVTTPQPNPPLPNRNSKTSIDELVEMGFDPQMSQEALKATKGNTQMAIQLLLDHNAASTRKSSESTSLFGQATSLLNKSRAIVASKIKDSSILTNVINVVQTQIDNLNLDNHHETANAPSESKSHEHQINAQATGDSSTMTRQASSNMLDIPKPKVEISPKARAPFVWCNPSVLASVQNDKDVGNDSYKRGQYEQAVVHYSQAISQLSTNHLLLVILYNNRATARLKTGEYKECLDDANAAISIINYYGGIDNDHPNNNEIRDPASDVKIVRGDQIKALIRRSAAFEHLEKYQQAKESFNDVIMIDHNNKLALDGISRCSKATRKVDNRAQDDSQMFKMFDSVESSPDKGKSISQSEVDASSKVQQLRMQENAAQAAADEALALKDQVDARILSWKKGKEKNLRALISSLEMVLWAELQWQPVNLRDLITPSQVKIRYIKAIGKVHPDKLNTTLVAHKMIANSVFAILNEAWDAFRKENAC